MTLYEPLFLFTMAKVVAKRLLVKTKIIMWIQWLETRDGKWVLGFGENELNNNDEMQIWNLLL